jgi:hypothetical protein
LGDSNDELKVSKQLEVYSAEDDSDGGLVLGEEDELRFEEGEVTFSIKMSGWNLRIESHSWSWKAADDIKTLIERPP